MATRQSGEITRAIHRELPDHAQEETPRQIDQQRAVGKGAPQTNLHDALKAVTRKRANGAKDRNQCNTQCCSNPRPVWTHQRIPCDPLNKKLLEPLGCQESSAPTKIAGAVVANSIAAYLNSKESVTRVRCPRNESAFAPSEMKTIAKLSSELPRIIPVRPAKGVGVIEEVA